MLVLRGRDVEALLDLDQLVDALAPAFVELSAGRASVPPRVGAATPNGGLLAAMPGYVGGILEAKLVSVFAVNEGTRVPTHQALLALFDAETGSPLAVMDGARITAARSAAASALATRVLARADAAVLAVVGAGVQGRAHLEAVPRVRRFREVRIASRSRERAEAAAADFGATLAATFEQAVRGADVVCLCTDASAPVVRHAWLEPGAHVTSVGASLHGGELDDETLRAGRLVVESRVAFQAPPAGAYELRELDPERAAELGEILSGTRTGRTVDDELTVYKSMGHAVEDAVAARLVYARAREAGVGTIVDL